MTDYTELKRLAEACGDLNWRAIQENWCEWAIRDDHAYIATMRTKSAKHPGPCSEREAKAKFLCAMTPAAVLALIAENERLGANVKLNLCDHPAIHWGDVDLLIAFVSGTSQIELAKMHGCTPPNISRKIRRVKARLGWRDGMSVAEIRARAEQLRELASQGAVVTADLMAERDRLKAEKKRLESEAVYAAAGFDAAREEIARIKAEIAGLRTGYEAYERVNAGLKGEVEALRNALRPLLAHWDDLRTGESLNVDAARAAMGKGSQS